VDINNELLNTPTQFLPIDVVQPNDWNPNEQDEETFQRLVDEITMTGMISPITVCEVGDGTYRIIGGEHRWRAALAIGYEEIEAKVLPAEWGDEDLQKLVTVRLNMLRGDLSAEKFLPLFNEMADKYGKEKLQDLFAITDDQAYRRLMSEMTQGVKKSLPPEMAQKFEEQAKDAKTADELGAIVEQLMNEHAQSKDKSFMIFSYGKTKQIFVQMDAAMQRAMNEVCDFLAFTSQDINDFMRPVVMECLERAEAQHAAVITPDVDEDDVTY